MRPRPAPMARRTAISFCRAAARASSRLATLAHAMSRTRATTAISTWSGLTYISRRYVQPVPPGTSSRTASIVAFFRSAGQCGATTASAMRGHLATICACATDVDSPGCGRARTRSQ